jgi:branched-chain amino acid aminotransferase
MSGGVCWLNGGLVPAHQARIDPADRGFTLGDGVFETVAVRRGQASHLGRHLHRMDRGAAMLGFSCPWNLAAVERATGEVIGAAAQGTGSLRLTLTRGSADRGLMPPQAPQCTLLIAWSAAATQPAGVRAVICRITRRNEMSPLAGVKSLNYLDSVIALGAAAAAGAQDAVLLNTQGRVACATAANLIALRGGRLLTPPLSDGVLPGIARALLIERAGVMEASLTPGELHTAEAVVLTSSLWIRQIARLDDTTYQPAPVLIGRLRQAAE